MRADRAVSTTRSCRRELERLTYGGDGRKSELQRQRRGDLHELLLFVMAVAFGLVRRLAVLRH